MKQRFDEAVAKYKRQIDTTWSVWHATQGVLMDDLMQARSMQFMRYVIVWLMRLASQVSLSLRCWMDVAFSEPATCPGLGHMYQEWLHTLC